MEEQKEAPIQLKIDSESYYSFKEEVLVSRTTYSNFLKETGELSISHETIYRYIWKNKRENGDWYKFLRQAGKQRRKRYRSYDSRGVMRGKRAIEDRPIGCLNRSRIGHFEVDTVWGKGSMHSILTLVDRKSGMAFIRKTKDTFN